MSYVIACDKRDDPNTTLFLTDRRRKQRESFWSATLDDDVEVFHHKCVAIRRAYSLRRHSNNPCVLTLARAQEMLRFEKEASWHDDNDDGAVTDAAKAGTFGYK